MSLETYIASTPNNPVTVKSDTLVLIPSRKEKKWFFATIFRVRAFYSNTGCRDFFLKCTMGTTIMFPLHTPWSETKPLKQNHSWKTKKLFPFENPGTRFRGQQFKLRGTIPTTFLLQDMFRHQRLVGIDLILPPGADWLVMSSRNGHPFRWVKNSPFPFCFGSSTFPQNVIYSKRFWQDQLSH